MFFADRGDGFAGVGETFTDFDNMCADLGDTFADWGNIFLDCSLIDTQHSLPLIHTTLFTSYYLAFLVYLEDPIFVQIQKSPNWSNLFPLFGVLCWSHQSLWLCLKASSCKRWKAQDLNSEREKESDGGGKEGRGCSSTQSGASAQAGPCFLWMIR